MTTDTGSDRATKRIWRRPHEGPIAGVCAGLAEYFEIDPTIVRIGAVVLACMGPGVPAYIIAWIFLPAAGHRSIAAAAAPRNSAWDRSSQVIGIGLLIIAISVLWGDWWSPAPRWFVPIGLVALGVWLLARRDRDDDPTLPGLAGDPPTWRAPGGAAATAAVPTTDDDTAPTTDEDTEADTADVADTITDPDTTTVAAGWEPGDGDRPPQDPPTVVGGPLDPPPPPSSPRRGRALGPIVFGTLLVWGGIAWLAEVQLEDALAIGLCIVGVGFVLGAFMGGAWPLVFPAVLIGVALLAASIVDIPLDGGIGDKTWTVDTVAEARDDFEVAIGRGELDLSQLDVPDGEVVEIDASVGLGELFVYVPEGVRLEVESSAGMGESDVLGHEDGGVNVDFDRGFSGDADRGTIELDLQVGLGRVEVKERAATRALERLPR